MPIVLDLVQPGVFMDQAFPILITFVVTCLLLAIRSLIVSDSRESLVGRRADRRRFDYKRVIKFERKKADDDEVSRLRPRPARP